ncbi:TVP38/TMEM64 family protein [soil metagenome]
MSQSETETETVSPTAKSGVWWKLVVAGILAAALVYTLSVSDVRAHLKDALDWIQSLGAWGPVAFIVTYIVVTVALVPGSVLTLGAGAVFGPVWGTVWVSIASVSGASAAFLVGRYAVRGWVKKKIDKHPKFKAVDEAIGEQSWKIVFLIRLSPLFPFNFLNYAFGVTKVKFWSHLSASWLGMLPGTIMYVYLGSLTTAGVRAEGGRTPMEWALLIVGLIATVTVSVLIARIAKKAINQRLQPGSQPGSSKP